MKPRPCHVGRFLAGRRGLAGTEEEVLYEHVVFHGVGEEDRMVDHRIVEGAAIWLILQQGRAVDPEDLQPHAEGCAKQRIRSAMRTPVRETDHRLMPPRRGVDALGVCGGRPCEDLDLGSGKTIALGMRVTHRPAGSLGLDRSLDVPQRGREDRLHILLERRFRALHSGREAHKGLRHIDSPRDRGSDPPVRSSCTTGYVAAWSSSGFNSGACSACAAAGLSRTCWNACCTASAFQISLTVTSG